MSDQDRQPLLHTPVSNAIMATHPNRYGAVLTALYSFLAARETALARVQTSQKDEYSVVLFDHNAQVSAQPEPTKFRLNAKLFHRL